MFLIDCNLCPIPNHDCERIIDIRSLRCYGTSQQDPQSQLGNGFQMFGSRRSSIFVRPIVPPEPRENMSDINEGRIPTKIKSPKSINLFNPYPCNISKVPGYCRFAGNIIACPIPNHDCERIIDIRSLRCYGTSYE
ncbi:hypothetical protein DERF_012424 [Dermatophagoides farinae]|uniref:Uncharacterized protein n=1 Tax=Dermatophagoides farinae TaxID=6954 RepID=A0A922L3F5_DERFA|nr:hypothetical protein DERF_012424 [Dermatophagoides farinae]